MADTDNVVDWEQAMDSVGGDPELLKAVIAAFLEEAPAKLKEIHQAIDERQTTLLHRAAHTLKGTLTYFGNQAAIERALMLELLGRRGTTEGAAPLAAELESQLARILQCLSAYLEQQAA
jgi:HPt (histidine-containing phosphotransfer) domain-containing protein